MTKKEIDEVKRKIDQSRARYKTWLHGSAGATNPLLPEPDVPLICGPRTKEESNAFFKKMEEERLTEHAECDNET